MSLNAKLGGEQCHVPKLINELIYIYRGSCHAYIAMCIATLLIIILYIHIASAQAITYYILLLFLSLSIISNPRLQIYFIY